MIAIPPWYARVPKTLHANLQWRLEVTRQGEGSDQTQQWIRDCCKEDPHFYFNGFVWFFDPRLREHKKIPALTFPIQDYAIERMETAIDKGRDLDIEKSRDLGASAMATGVFQRRWLFLPDQTFLMISRNEDEVDKPGKRGSLFWKIDNINAHLPIWLMPKGWSSDCRRKFMLENPQNGSTITGAATVAAASVGDRLTAILIDEFSRIEYADDIELGSADATDCRIFNYTAYGEGTAADRRRRDPSVRKIRLHWSADPRKNKKMYRWDGEQQRFRYFRFDDEKLDVVECEPHEYGPEDDDDRNVMDGAPPIPFRKNEDGRLRSPRYDIEFRRRKNPLWMAINWDIDWRGSESKFFDPDLLLELHAETTRDPLWEGDIRIDEGSGTILEFIPKKNGPLRFWFRWSEGDPFPTSALAFGAGADVSRGLGATNSCFSLGNSETGVKLCEYVTPYQPPDRFALRCLAICGCFLSEHGEKPLLAWERLGPGEEFRKLVMEMDYPNVYYPNQPAIRSAFAVSDKQLPGWQPSAKARADLFGEYQMSLRRREFVNRSVIALAECADFLETPRGCEYKYSHATKRKVHDEHSGATANHGDRPTADALCNRAMIEVGRPSVIVKPTQEADAAQTVGTWAWRAAIHERLERQRRGDRIWS